MTNFRNSYLINGTLLLSLIITSGCAGKKVKVEHPPRVMLNTYAPIGVIAFSDNATPSVSHYLTTQFLDYVQGAQPGTPLLELGTVEEVLNDLDVTALNTETYRKIGKKYNVAAVFVGEIEYNDIETGVDFKSLMDFKAKVDSKLRATLSARLYETQAGARVWGDSATWTRNLANLNMDTKGSIDIDADGYQDAYRKLIPDMVHDVTADFRYRYTYKKVK